MAFDIMQVRLLIDNLMVQICHLFLWIVDMWASFQQPGTVPVPREFCMKAASRWLMTGASPLKMHGWCWYVPRDLFTLRLDRHSTASCINMRLSCVGRVLSRCNSYDGSPSSSMLKTLWKKLVSMSALALPLQAATPELFLRSGISYLVFSFSLMC